MNIFELMREHYFLPDKPKLFEAFAGIGCQRLAFKRLGIEVEMIGISEIDKYALQSYMAIHGDTKNYGSITDIKGTDLPPIDVFTWSFPCFTKDMLVLTDEGYKKIIDVKENDLVLTHDNSYQRVVRFIDNGVKETVKIKGMAFDEITCTKEHRFYTRKLKRVYFHKHKTQSRIFESPKWLSVNELTKDHYLGIAINQNSIVPDFNVEDKTYIDGRIYKSKNIVKTLLHRKEFWYIVGRYLGDGWLRHQGGIIICCKESELKEITSKLEILNINHNIVKERTVLKIHISQKEFGLYFEQFGKGAENKRLTKDVFDLPIDLLESLLDGYIDSDGYITKDNVYKTSSVSKELTYGIGQCVAKAYKTPFKIYKSKRKPTCVIEGRTTNQKDSYQLVFKKDIKKQDKAFYEDGYIWFPIKSIEYNEYEKVYDLEIEKSHSFTVNNVIVHNCTDLSKAGKQQGMSSETRSGLVYEVLRILNESTNKPKVLIMENVVDLVQSKFIQQFNEIQLELEQLGYVNYVETMNAKNYGVAQNRDRVFMVSILGDYYYEFPKPFKLEKRLKDYLEDEVDEKYYISDKMFNYLTDETDRNGFVRGKRFNPHEIESNYAYAITTNAGNRPTDNFIKIPEDTKKGYSEAYEGDGVYINRPHQKRGVVQEGMIQTLKTSGSDVGVVVPFGSYYTWADNQGNINTQCNRAADEEGYALTVACAETGKVFEDKLRIRKLTPLEVWRLMGIDDEDFEKASKVVSNSQLYKQAGNGIVVDVFAKIIENMTKGDV